MLDYSLIAAVAAVVREGSFERAARALHITPSAVSQRVKLLEQRLGQVLVVRGNGAAGCTATEAGHQVCSHAEQVALLEHHLAQSVPGLHQGASGDASAARVTLRVAVNADSLATWFMPAAAEFCHADAVLLDVRLEDQDHTADQLRRGEVLAAVTTLATPVQGCRSLALGRMRYLATASPAFVARHFGEGVNCDGLALAPCLTFNNKDRLQEQWLQQQCKSTPELQPPKHWLPATQAFVDACLAGLGWGMNPATLVAGALRSGQLVELVPHTPLWVPLHWQHARASAPQLGRLTAAVLAAAQAGLEPMLVEA
jgi:LysR family transcriptional regulator, chromosome initiation inhibitor